jgi:hypothetical protein
MTIRGLRTHREAPRLTAPVIVVTAVAISGSAASVVLLCRVRPRLRGPVAAAAGAMLAYAGSDAAGTVGRRRRSGHCRVLRLAGAGTVLAAATAMVREFHGAAGRLAS